MESLPQSAEEGSQDMFCEVHWDIAYGNSDPQVPIYSSWSWKNFVIILPPANLAACSSVGSRISHVTKLCQQQYLHGIPAVFSTQSSEPPGSEVGGNKGKALKVLDITDGQDCIFLGILGVIAHCLSNTHLDPSLSAS